MGKRNIVVGQESWFVQDKDKQKIAKNKWSWKTAHLTPGSGIIIVKKINNEWKVLGMWARGGYDIPKGHIEEGEGVFETAVRETFEESNISELNFQWGKEYKIFDRLTVYLASTTQDPKVLKNKESGIFEHDRAEWLEWDVMEKGTYDYLKPAIRWAKKVVAGEQT